MSFTFENSRLQKMLFNLFSISNFHEKDKIALYWNYVELISLEILKFRIILYRKGDLHL